MSNLIQYRTFDELMSAVASDMKSFDLEGFLDPGDFIKIAQRINKELTVKINPEKDTVLHIEKGRCRLPTDFYMVNYAVQCVGGCSIIPIISGVQTEDVLVDRSHGACPHTQVSECGQSFQVVQTFKYETRTYRNFRKLRFIDSHGTSPNCPNTQWVSPDTAYIKDGWIYTSVDEADIYMSYTADMVDEDGNLLVLDHPICNEYYEYAIKKRILENMVLNGEDVVNQLKYIDQQRRNARIEAVTLVNMGDFSEHIANFQMNRRAMYNKYYHQFH